MRFAAESLACRGAIASEVVESSRDNGWTTLLLDRHRVTPDDNVFETRATPDQTIVVMLDGEQVLDAFVDGMWRRTIYRAGTLGLTPGARRDRLRRLVGRHATPFEKANLYIPAGIFAEVADHYARSGRPVEAGTLNALAYFDPLVLQAVVSLLRAMRSGVPDLYAEATAQWLATHLLSSHGARFDRVDVAQGPRAILDRRLARVVDLMSTRFAEPLSLDELAAEAAVSKYHFVRLFRLQVGVTPHRLLMQLRLDAARSILASTDLDIKSIAGRCGFTRGVDLTTAFTRRFGMSPTRWRACRRGMPSDRGGDIPTH